MTKEEFYSITSVLEKNYDKQYDEVVLKLWYREFKDYSTQKYKRLVIEAIRRYTFLPTLAEMLKIELLPEWFDKKIEKKEASIEEREEIEKMLSKFK